MQRPASFFLLPVLLGAAALAVVSLLLPPETEGLRRIVTGILAIGLGFQIARAIAVHQTGRAAACKAWLECLTFPLVMGACLLLPAPLGWGLLVAGIAWRHVVAVLVRG